MNNYRIILSENFAHGKYVLIVNGTPVAADDSIMVLANLVAAYERSNTPLFT